MYGNQQQRRENRHALRRNQLYKWREKGYKINYILNDSYSINNRIVVHLIHNRFENKLNRQKGYFNNIDTFMEKYVKHNLDPEVVLNYIDAPKLPYFRFLRFRPKLRKFIRAYNTYRSIAYKYEKTSCSSELC